MVLYLVCLLICQRQGECQTASANEEPKVARPIRTPCYCGRLLSNGVSLPLITELLRSESLPNGRVDILVVNAIKKHIKGM